MTSDIPIGLGFAEHIIRCIELGDKKGLDMIKKQLIVRVYNTKHKVRIAHSSLIPLISYEIENEIGTDKF